jgi:hypothetical protein
MNADARRFFNLLGLVLALLLAACGQGQPTITATLVATTAAPVVVATDTPNAVPLATPSATMRPAGPAQTATPTGRTLPAGDRVTVTPASPTPTRPTATASRTFSPEEQATRQFLQDGWATADAIIATAVAPLPPCGPPIGRDYSWMVTGWQFDALNQ